MRSFNIAVIGLGYVGLPLAIEFSKKFTVIGFDINSERVDELLSGIDKTKEADIETLTSVMKKINQVIQLDYHFQVTLMT